MKDENIIFAFITAQESLKKMIELGLGETKFVFALSNVLSEKYNLTQDKSIFIIEEAIKKMG